MPIRLLTSGGGTTTIQPTTSASSVTLTVPSVNANVVTTGDTASVTQAMLGSGLAGTGPAFSAYLATNQSYTTPNYTKVTFQTEEYDTASCYDNTTNYRFTPNVAGYYLFTWNVQGNATNRSTAYLYKNGSAYKSGVDSIGNGSNNNSSNGSAMAYANGSTDYFEIYFQGNINNTLVGSSVATFFQGYLARAA